MLSVRNLAVSFRSEEGRLVAVDGVSFEIGSQEVVGIVGESGCGKSVTALSLLRLISEPGRIEQGEILFEGQDLLHLTEKQMRAVRGEKIAMIFQEPMSSLNPVYTVEAQIAEAIRLHKKLPAAKVRARVIELLQLVGIAAPEERMRSYPHQLSGGMRQRVMIAMALSCEPRLLIADEPTTALDVTIQAQILELLLRLQKELGMSVLLITHDLGIVAEFVDHVIVMYAGKVVENASTQDLFQKPLHPYTLGLLGSVPTFERIQGHTRLPTISGMVPDLRTLPAGCRFQDRCAYVIEPCRVQEPPLDEHLPAHRAACFRALEPKSLG